jgi:hypothetical protein
MAGRKSWFVADITMHLAAVQRPRPPRNSLTAKACRGLFYRSARGFLLWPLVAGSRRVFGPPSRLAPGA